MRRPRPRTLGILCACLALLGPAVVAEVRGAVGWRGSVTLLAGWSGEEREQFEEHVVEPFERTHRIDVVYQGSSALSQVLAADMAAGNPPDVVILPGPGELLSYALDGRLHPVDDLFDAGHYDDIWVPEVSVPGRPGRHAFWLPVKIGLKSMVWYAGERPAAGAAGDRERWCLGMESGATSGWPGTDWVEDVLLHQAGPRTYEKWARGELAWTDPAVRRAWTTWGELVGAGEEHVRPALTTAFGKECPAGNPEHQGAFRTDHWRRKGGDFVHFSEVLGGAGPRTRAWSVSGDLAALVNPTEEGRQLIRYLADPDTALPEHRANEEAAPEGDRDATRRRIAGILRGAPGQPRCWDASDTMSRALRDAFHLAVLRHLVDPAELDVQLGRLQRLQQLGGGHDLPVCSHD
ncbi:ABC transporter substrate-binding protein [Streptomyces sp. LE64]|uniref:ABC transporter substrate-binding protein n=1 Tax=Streptomyces sp. LE64 TaxID=3448653 RepID=UPI004042ED3A